MKIPRSKLKFLDEATRLENRKVRKRWKMKSLVINEEKQLNKTASLSLEKPTEFSPVLPKMHAFDIEQSCSHLHKGEKFIWKNDSRDVLHNNSPDVVDLNGPNLTYTPEQCLIAGILNRAVLDMKNDWSPNLRNNDAVDQSSYHQRDAINWILSSREDEFSCRYILCELNILSYYPSLRRLALQKRKELEDTVEISIEEFYRK